MSFSKFCLLSFFVRSLHNMASYKIKPSHHFDSQVTSISHLGSTIRNITEKLNEEQLRLFRATQFGPFLDVNLSFNGQLIHFLLLRELDIEDDDSITFRIGKVVCSFGRREFNLVTGMWEPKSTPIRNTPENSMRQLFFSKQTSLSVGDLEGVFLRCDGEGEEVVRLAILYLIEICLMGKDKRTKIDLKHLDLCDKWATLDGHDWGELIFRRTILGLKKALDGRLAKGQNKATKSKYTVVGFPHALQVCLPSFGVLFLIYNKI